MENRLSIKDLRLLKEQNTLHVSQLSFGGRILYQDEALVAIDKPAGLHTHPPEDERHRIKASQNGLALLRDHLGQWLYPVHRLDAATSGVLIYALTKEAAAKLCGAFQSGEVHKKYLAVTRGVTPEQGEIDRPLKRDSSDTFAPARTRYRRLSTIEIAKPVGRYPTARYSLLEIKPETGRFHQIRRHMAGISYPLIGDTVHGDGEHNRFFREQMMIHGLLLRAQEIDIPHPLTGERLQIRAENWSRVCDLF